MGDMDTNEDSLPNIIPELQNRSVIDAVIGEFHYGALTADGQLLTWGNYPSESLGLGTFSSGEFYTTQSQAQELVWGPHQSARAFAPSPVHFNHGPNPSGRRYCFAATTGEYHMGALVICLEVSHPFRSCGAVQLTCEFSSPRKRYMMMPVHPPKTVDPCQVQGALSVQARNGALLEHLHHHPSLDHDV
jgi:hypothetical protein